MDPATLAIQEATEAKAGDATPPKRQFTLAQLLAMVFGIGVLMAAGLVISNIDDARPLDWIIAVGGFVAASVAFFAARLPRVGGITIGVTLLFAILAVLAPALGTAKHAARRSACQGHLKQIVVALHSYHDQYGCFPPAVVRDESGRPMHSWRVLLLPYLEQQAVYAKYRFDEPWDGPNNKKLHDIAVPSYSCPEQPGRGSNPITHTSYVVVVGPRTAFPEDRGIPLSDITDSHGQTILVVEVAGSGIHWMEPRDLHVTQMARQINPPRGQGISSLHGPRPSGGANVVMVDGTVKFLDTKSLTANQIEGLLTIAGGEP